MALATIIISVSCVKDEYVLGENTVVPGLEPTLAIPLANAKLGLGELEPNLDLDPASVISQTGQVLSVSFTERLFDFTVDDLVDIPDQEVQESLVADALIAALFNATFEGQQLELPQTFELPFDFENGEILDSIILQEATLNIDIISTFRHDLDVDLGIPQLTQNQVPFQETVILDYQGTVPVIQTLSFDVSNGVLDFTAPGLQNQLEILTDLVVTHSGEFTNIGDSLGFAISLSANSLHSAYGYLGQFAGLADVDTQRVDIFESIDADRLFFADPSIDLLIENSSGIPMEIDFSSLIAPDNQFATIITGGALEEIPPVSAAAFLGDIAVTEHRIDNSNTEPSLSDMLSEGPVDLIYTAEGLTNPEGFQYNFIQDTSRISCDATVNLPLYGYVDGYTFSDTLDVNLAVDLGIGEAISIDDVELVTIRTIFDNGLPLEAGLQVVFLDSLDLAFDSLFTDPFAMPIAAAGMVDHQLDASHPLHGKVQERTRLITDIPMSQERISEILAGNTKRIIVRVLTSTSAASDLELVKFFPEDEIEVQLSAKVETIIALGE